MTDKEVMQSAMNEHCPACGYYCLGNGGVYCIDKPTTVETTRACLAQPEQYDQTELALCKKCGWKAVWPDGCLVCEKQETQPEKEWVGLTDDEVLKEFWNIYPEEDVLFTDVERAFYRAIKNKLKAKNT